MGFIKVNEGILIKNIPSYLIQKTIRDKLIMQAEAVAAEETEAETEPQKHEKKLLHLEFNFKRLVHLRLPKSRFEL